MYLKFAQPRSKSAGHFNGHTAKMTHICNITYMYPVDIVFV